jgi:uncharacterized protein YycO
MKRLIALMVFAVAALGGAGAGDVAKSGSAALQDGDILFQSLPHSPLVDSIEGCTGSSFSHCGIAHRSGADWTVIEAIGPVREIPLAQWVRQSRDGHFTAYRLRESYRHHIPQMIAATRSYFGRPYDIAYQFDDEKIYCSELIFKAFRTAAGEDLGRIQTLGELDWRPRQAVIEKINGGPVPLERRMITPKALSEARQLERIGTDLNY